MSKIYIPGINEDIFLDTKDVVLGDYRLIILVQLIYELDKRYKIEKIISFNNKSYEKEIISLISHNIELYNREIDGNTGYFHITFEKKLDNSVKLPRDYYCDYAISLVIKDDYFEEKSFIEDFEKKMNNILV